MESQILGIGVEDGKEGGVSSAGGLEQLLEGVVREGLHARTHWNLVKGLDAAIGDCSEETKQSGEVWAFTLLAQYDAVLFHLGRLYDQEHCSLSLRRLLLAVRSRVHFTKDSIQPCGLSGGAPPLEESVDRDLANVSVSNAPVRRLNELRDRMIFDDGPRPVRLQGLSALALSSEDIESLIETARQIGNRYGALCRMSRFSGTLAGGDDSLRLRSLLHQDLASTSAGRNADLNRGREQPPPWSPADCLAI